MRTPLSCRPKNRLECLDYTLRRLTAMMIRFSRRLTDPFPCRRGGKGGQSLLGLVGTLLAIGCSVSEPPPPSVAQVPFAVSEYFSPTGFFDDPDGLTLDVDEACAERPEGAQGSCYRVEYAPSLAEDSEKWAGIFWQWPAGNWGAKLGREVSAGATQVSFYAALVIPEGIYPQSVQASFLVGAAAGIDSVTGSPLPYFDDFDLAKERIQLDGILRRYTMELPPYVEEGEDSTRVYGAFGFVLSAPIIMTDPSEGEKQYGSATLYLDDIRWE